MSNSASQLAYSDLRSQAQVLDGQDHLRATREEFRIPTRADIKRKTLGHEGEPPFLTSVHAQALMRSF